MSTCYNHIIGDLSTLVVYEEVLEKSSHQDLEIPCLEFSTIVCDFQDIIWNINSDKVLKNAQVEQSSRNC